MVGDGGMERMGSSLPQEEGEWGGEKTGRESCLKLFVPDCLLCTEPEVLHDALLWGLSVSSQALAG